MTTHDEALRALEKLTGTFSIEEWRVADRTLRRYINEQREVAAVPDCPYPCGWRELHRIATRRAAYLATYLVEGAEVSEEMRRAAIKQGEALILICRDMLARLEQKEQPDAEAQ